jgi:hypothetical protein
VCYYVEANPFVALPCKKELLMLSYRHGDIEPLLEKEGVIVDSIDYEGVIEFTVS